VGGDSDTEIASGGVSEKEPRNDGIGDLARTGVGCSGTEIASWG